MKPSLEMKLKTALHFSYEMQQAIHILSLPITEMEEYIASEVPDWDFPLTKASSLAPFDIPAPDPSPLEEIRDIFSSKEEEKRAEILFHHFDKNGFLRESIEELAKDYEFDYEELKSTLLLIQNTFKNGIGATSFQEAFLIQLKPGSIAYTILEDHYNDFLHKRYAQIGKELHLSEEDVEEIIQEEILPLHIPSLKSMEGNALPLAIDIFLSREEDVWHIEIPTPDLPIDHWLFPICERRALILKNITLYLTVHMGNYLVGETPYMPPLLLKEMALTLSLSESTITRAVSGKYISTPRGILPLRDLFSLPLQEGLSTQKAKVILLELLAKEKNLSDGALSLLMKEKGIPIERRTVAKYRQELGIPAKHLR